MSDRENSKDDDDLSLPKTTVQKLITEMLPKDVACSRETRDVLVDCCVEFIHLLASEANEVCEKESKKTISADHVISALQRLGYEEYLPDIKAVFEDHKNTMKIRDKKSNRLENTGLTAEQLLAAQEQLFASARQKYQAQSLPLPVVGPAATDINSNSSFPQANPPQSDLLPNQNPNQTFADPNLQFSNTFPRMNSTFPSLSKYTQPPP